MGPVLPQTTPNLRPPPPGSWGGCLGVRDHPRSYGPHLRVLGEGVLGSHPGNLARSRNWPQNRPLFQVGWTTHVATTQFARDDRSPCQKACRCYGGTSATCPGRARVLASLLWSLVALRCPRIARWMSAGFRVCVVDWVSAGLRVCVRIGCSTCFIAFLVKQ